jgi:hypothetical protein
MSGTLPEVVDTNMFDQPHQRLPQTFHMSYSDIARSSGSPLTQSQNNSQDVASVDTTIASNVSRQETNDSGMNMITGLSLMQKRMEEIDNQREAFMTKQQRMDKSIITVTSSVSKLSADILAVRIDMNCFNLSASSYCWAHGYKVGSTHTSLTCKLPKPGHKTEATRADNMGGSQANRE